MSGDGSWKKTRPMNGPGNRGCGLGSAGNAGRSRGEDDEDKTIRSRVVGGGLRPPTRFRSQPQRTTGKKSTNNETVRPVIRTRRNGVVWTLRRSISEGLVAITRPWAEGAESGGRRG